MEENNRKGPGVFYAVVGVATLVVAIIGATFAYFSASADADGDDITGSTNDALATSLHLTVNKVTYADVTAAKNDLVPTNLDASDATKLSVALGAKCEADGYTACHVYKITASSDQTVANVNLYLDSLTVAGTNLKDKADWKYVIYQGSESAATSLIAGGAGSMDMTSKFDMHKNASMTATQEYVYYLVVYLHDDNQAQNEAGDNNSTGTYTGSVSMEALGGKVAATFTYS